ncbi:MAG: glycosyltransferase 61 family protein [Magnetococcus sp. XQGC-1]
MQLFLETVFQLDASNDVAGLLQFVQRPEHEPKTMLFTALRLLNGGRVRPAYILAMLLANQGYKHTVIWTALALGGLLYGNSGENLRGMEELRAQAEALPAEQPFALYSSLITPLMHPFADPETYGNNIHQTEIFAMLQAGVPPLRARFDWEEPPAACDLEQMRQRGRHGQHPVRHPSPPPNTPRPPRRVVLVARAAIFLYQTQWPRPLDLESRLASAMTRYGWQVSLCSIRCVDLAEDYRHILAACQQHQAEIAILDDDLLLSKKVENLSRLTRPLLHHSAHREMLTLLRTAMPSLKLVGLLSDTHSIAPPLLAETLALLDCVWDMAPTAPTTWQTDSPVEQKIIRMPPPLDADIDLLAHPLSPRLLFIGAETHYSRLWMAAAEHLHLPIQNDLSSRLGKLPVRDRQSLLRQALTQESCHLHLATHPSQSDPLPALCFESIRSGALLVAEYSPNMHHYFLPGEHYLEFTTLAELSGITRFITENRAAADEIRRNGARFAHQQYSDTQWIASLDALLYFSETEKNTAPHLPRETELLTYEYLSVHAWCRPTTAATLLSEPGNQIAYCHPLQATHTPINFPGLRARGQGYEPLFPWDEATLIFPEVDFKTHRVMPKTTPFVARLDNVLIDYPLLGIFLDRHLLMEESQHDKRSTMNGREPFWENIHPGSATRFAVDVQGAAPSPNLLLDVKYRVDRGSDHYETGPAILLGGRGMDNYHHWMMEFLPRLWCMRFIPELRALPVIMYSPLLPFHLETLHAIGIPSEQIIILTTNTRFGTLIFPSHIAPKYSYSEHCITWMRETLLPAFSIQSTSPPQNFIYVSRNKAQQRRVLNEEAVIAQLQSRGFHVLYMENMSVKEQVETFNNARVVVMPHGAAGTNMVFAQPGTVLIELMPRSYIHAMCLLFTAFNGCHYGTLLCDDSGSPARKDMAVDIGVLMRIVDQVLADLPEQPVGR